MRLETVMLVLGVMMICVACNTEMSLRQGYPSEYRMDDGVRCYVLWNGYIAISCVVVKP